MKEISAVPFSALPPASDGYTVLYENDQVCRSDKKLSELVGSRTSSFLTKEQGDNLYQEKGDYLVDDDITGKLDKSQYAVDSATFLTAHQVIPSGKWENASDVVIANSAIWGSETDWTEEINAASAYAYDKAAIQIDKKLDKSFSSNFYPMNENPSGYLTGVDLSNYYTKNETSGKTEIANALTAKQNVIQSKKNSSLPYLETSNSEPSWEVIESEQINAHGTAQEGEVYNTTINGRAYTMVCLNGKLWLAENYVDSTKASYTDSTYGSYFTKSQIANAIPQGWHLPTKEDFQELIDAETEHCEKYLATTDWNTPLDYQGNPDPNYIAGTNELKLNILPGGEYIDGLVFEHYQARFWTSTDETLSQSTGKQRVYVKISNYIGYNSKIISFDWDGPGSNYRFSVRLIKDDLDVSGPDCWKTFKGKNFMAIADNEGNTFKDFYLKKVEAQATYQPIGNYASSAGVETLNTYYALTTTGWKDIAEDFYDKTTINNSLSLKQDLLVFVGTNNIIETINGSAISSQGGSTPTGLYVPLSAKFCTIGNDNKIAGGGYYGEFAQGQFNSAGEGCLVQGYKNSGYRYSISQGSANSAGIFCITVGNGNKANLDAISVGDVNSAENYAISVGSGNSAEIRVMCLGTANSAGQDSISVGQRNTAYCESIAVGRINLANTDAVAIGSQNTATTIAVAVGTSNSANNYAFAFGGNSKSDSWSLANGGGVTAKTYSLGVGNNISSNYACLGVGGQVSADQTACSVGMCNTALSASMAIGNYTSASNRSMSVGSYCSADENSFALGSGNKADYYSVAIGKQNYAYSYSFAFGFNNSAYYGYPSYNYNVTIGNNNTAYEGGYALGIDNYVEIGGFAYGKNNEVNQGWAFGEGLKINGNVFAIGEYNKSSADVAFVIGYGDDDSTRKDIFKILSKNDTDRGIASGKDFWSENGAKLNLLAKLCSAISSHSTGKYNLILNNGDVEVEQIS